eukprot:TRINITY_DN22459_c0_g1_i1.p1 TRINITY_DN22459_c0_g1~~TRINITY_DN22459_c0_g1_i1.p1  ORF type:complete len:301 (+),score=59.21 TRINITY_DN22459_c0_g1_i1:67-903(+)
MSRKRPRLEFNAGVADVGGLYDFLPKPSDDELAVVPQVELKPLPPQDNSLVIFLDIDGVLKPEGETARVLVDGEMVPILPKVEGDVGFNKMAVRALRTIVQNTGASIVLSSEWRRSEVMRNAVGINLRSGGLPQVRTTTITTIKPKMELVKANSMIAFAERRAREIAEFLQRHPQVRSWVALDDVDLGWADGYRTPGTPLMRSRLVRTDAKVCLTEKDAQEAVRILLNPPVLTAEQEAGAVRRASRKLQAAFPMLRNPDRIAEEHASAPKPVPRRQNA